MRCILFIMLFLGYSSLAYAEPSPNFYAENGIGPKYRIADAYKDSDMVVIGHIVGKDANGSDLRFKIEQLIKGAPTEEIILRGQIPINTEINGFHIPENIECLLLLRKVGVIYEKVDGFNTVGATYYIVKDDKVIMADAGGHYSKALAIPRTEIKKYFESNPEPLWLP